MKSAAHLDYMKDPHVREKFKDLEDRIGRLEASLSQGNIDIDIGSGGDLTKHAWTHASRRTYVQNSGTDPLGGYEMDWTNRHQYQPSLKSYTPTKWEAHANQTADLKKLEDPEGTEQNTVDPRGNATWRGASVKGAGNFGHGGSGTPPTEVSGLVMWFDARTVRADSGGIAPDAVITKWVDRTGNYVGTPAHDGAGASTNAKLRVRLVRGVEADAVDCDNTEGDGVYGTYPSNAANPNDGSTIEDVAGNTRWFDVSPNYTTSSDITVICLYRELLYPSSADQPNLCGSIFNVGAGEEQSSVRGWPHVATADGVAGTAEQPEFKIRGWDPGSAVKTGTARVAFNGWDAGAFTGTMNGLGYLQLCSFVFTVITDSGNTGRRCTAARLNGTDQTLGTPGEMIDGDTEGLWEVIEVCGGRAEYYQLVVFSRALSTAELQQVENYFASIYNMNEIEFVAAADDPQKQYAITLQKDDDNWCGFHTDSKGVTRTESYTDASTDISRFQVRPEVIPSANFSASPATDGFDEGELVWCDYGSGTAALLVVVDTDGAGTLGWREIWRT